MAKDEVKIEYDIKNISEAGFDKYLNRSTFGEAEKVVGNESRYKSLRNISGGLLSGESRLYMGNQQMYFDGKQVKFTVNDGNTDVLIIGKLPS